MYLAHLNDATKIYIIHDTADWPRGDDMRLTRYTDYALRVLLYLAAHPDRICSISEISRGYGISQNHLMKVVHDLGKAGYVASVRGRLGGIRLARSPAEINIGAVIRHSEDGFDLVDCGECVIAPACGLTSVLNEAVSAFLAVVDSYTLDDLMAKRGDMMAILAQARTISTLA
jgi:Rrf2 family nitric oxide-sensitive transcriptional repressor